MKKEICTSNKCTGCYHYYKNNWYVCPVCGKMVLKQRDQFGIRYGAKKQ